MEKIAEHERAGLTDGQILAALKAFKRGNFSASLPEDLVGTDGAIADAFNDVVRQNRALAEELARLRKAFGRDGKTSERAKLENVSGGWRECVDSVNELIDDTVTHTAEISRVVSSVAQGDLSRTMATEVDGRRLKGDFLKSAKSINTMVDRLSLVSSEVTRVAREVGTEGKLGGQAKVRNVEGTWRDLTDNVNAMATNLTGQVRNIAEVTTAVARGDLSKKITVDVKGEILELKNTINTMVDQLNSFASEVTRVAREVGTEGKLGGQAKVEGVAGTWKDLTDNVNSMAGNLTVQLRDVSKVATAIANGDLTQQITVDAQGEILQIKEVINTMVGQLSSFASEVTRVAREVGTEGKLGGQARVEGVAGTWKDLTENVNGLATNLTTQVRNIAEVTTAVARGDLSKKITVNVQGEILELKNTINTMVDQLSSFASEVTRVAREVGTEGQLGGQAKVEGVAGTWKDLTDNVNSMAGNLTVQLRDVSKVATAIANGDLTQKITVDVQGEILQIKDVINTMVDQLSSFASEVTRVAREVGTEGKLGGQAKVEGVAGTWKDLTDNVNAMATNLTGQVRNIAEVTTAVARGDLSKKITVDVQGEIFELKATINTMVDQLNSFASEVTRVAREVGTEGKLGGEAKVEGADGTWKDLTQNVNAMATNLTGQVRNIAEVTTAVARGDLSKKITVDVKGEILELKNTINTMVDQLNGFASEVTRVASEVGIEGKLGGQAKVEGVGGTWKDLTDNVNMMATNLTNQVRGIAHVVTAVANGDLKRKLTVDAKGEIAELAETINGMIDTLATFGDQVTDVAREVGIEGKLGGQAEVPGASGLWRDLTDNVNQLADNLTTQVRAIAEVATAVAAGDLTRSIAVEAKGEVAALKDNINQMISNLRETTEYNEEQDWLKTNLARFTRIMQGERDLVTVCNLLLSETAPLIEVHHGAFYVSSRENDEQIFKLTASYAMNERKRLSNSIMLREGLVGQCAFERQRILLTNVPSDYVQIWSGLGEAPPLNIVVLPVIFEDEVLAVIELASFNRFTPIHLSFLEQLMESIAIVLNTISATMRTEDLLKQSQILTSELQSQQAELKSTNDRLEQQARSMKQSEELLKNQQEELRTKNEELEEKADQLALTSKYKSEFLANMSHELRTPLNSLLILSKLLSENPRGNLSEKQVEQARTIHDAGSDLLRMINDILDLSKIESGTVALDISEMSFSQFQQQTERTFRELAEEKELAFIVDIAENLPPVMTTDAMRLQQIINNLLSNAFKFTEEGSVSLSVYEAPSDGRYQNSRLEAADTVVAFAIMDTGIGVTESQQQVIFEAFQQADGTTSRRYGGTGLGLSISRELAGLLGGEIRLESTPGEGSTFTLLLPLSYTVGVSDPAGNSTLGLPVKRSRNRSANDLVPVITSNSSLPERIDRTTSPIVPQEARKRPLIAIVEDDPVFANILVEIAKEQGFDSVVVSRGRELPLIIRQHRPDAVSLDIQLPDIDGWVLIDMLRQNCEMRHLPIHVISVVEDETRLRDNAGIEYSAKPLSREQLAGVFDRLLYLAQRRDRTVLLVRDGEIETRLEGYLAKIRPVTIEPVAMKDAAKRVAQNSFDYVLVQCDSVSEPLRKLVKAMGTGKGGPFKPILVVVNNEPSKKDVELFASIGAFLHVQGRDDDAALTDEAARLLNLPWTLLPLDMRDEIQAARPQDNVLAGRTVAIIDDDIRNIFSMTSLLEEEKVVTISAEDGRAGIALLEKNPDVSAVLVDIMMPEMDGYETMQRIRKSRKFRDLPLIAVTAKAMQEDRDRCFESGASDYLSKPVDKDELIAVLRTWMKRRYGPESRDD